MLTDLLQNRKGKRIAADESTKVKDKRSLQEKLINFGKKLKKTFSKESVLKLQEEGRLLSSLVSFFGLLLIFLFELLWNVISSIWGIKKLAGGVEKIWDKSIGSALSKLIGKLESDTGDVQRSFLIALAFRNMRMKRTRSFVTVGGMALGIGAIVFLVSIGYGLQDLVVSRVARLEELRMADVTLASSSNIRLDGKAISTIKSIEGVERVMPVISTVGKVSFGGGVGETVVYGVTGNYLKASGFNRLQGSFFETQEYAYVPAVGDVAGVTTHWDFAAASYKKTKRNVVFNIEEGEWLRVRSEPSVNSEIIGYVKRYEGGFDGTELWGDSFLGDERGSLGRTDSGSKLGLWIKAPLPLWEQVENAYEPLVDEHGLQDWKEGYVAELGVIINEEKSVVFESVNEDPSGDVLGEATGSAAITQTDEEASLSAVVVGRDEQGVEWVEIVGDPESTASNTVEELKAPRDGIRQAVVNTSFLQLMGFDERQAVGEVIGLKFVILPSLKSDLVETANTENMEYEIVSVIDEGDGPVMYVPFDDLQALGIDNYSQAKMVIDDKGILKRVREQVDNLGYKTSSVADTVARIDQLFASVRIILATFGLVALAVASLGMFNTLTVSLMERTHEVGVMKAMGMKSNEVRELFLSEAMVMGLLGGIFGVLLGWAAGKLLSLLLSIFALIRGVGFINISTLPVGFVLIVITLSFLVGVLTGIYPARRAKNISALDALRYE